VARLTDGAELLKCSFCGKSQKQVRKLIGGSGAYICDECIELCNEIIEEELGKQPSSSAASPLPVPPGLQALWPAAAADAASRTAPPSSPFHPFARQETPRVHH